MHWSVNMSAHVDLASSAGNASTPDGEGLVQGCSSVPSPPILVTAMPRRSPFAATHHSRRYGVTELVRRQCNCVCLFVERNAFVGICIACVLSIYVLLSV
jgi:hypothetical protein